MSYPLPSGIVVNYTNLRPFDLSMVRPFDELRDRRAEESNFSMTTAWSYILECRNGEYYVGSTTDVERRLEEHQAGLGGDFTRKHRPVKLVYKEEYASIEQAFQRERQLHGWSRAKKEALIKGDLEKLKELSGHR